MPLFDRLVDHQPTVVAEPVPRHTLDLDGLVRSVEREIQRLVSSRVSQPIAVLGRRDRSVIDYGLGDLGRSFSDSKTDMTVLSRHIARTIAAFEPRLLEVAVTVASVHREVGRVTVDVVGKVRYENRLEPIAFPIVVALDAAPVT